tara:strand:+ start:1389 stop:1736 length:348 start_codon:yes stop_codon:yes gene_type:complete
MKNILLSILLVSSLNALVFPVDTTTVVNNPKTAFKWSLIPGLCQGQMYNGSYLRAMGLFALQAYSLDKIYEYREAGDIKQRNSYFWTFAGFYFLSVVDAYVESHLTDFPKNMEEN